MFFKVHNRKLAAVALILLGLILASLAWFWITAPADPVYNGIRLSRHLYRSYGSAPGRRYEWPELIALRQECDLALKQLGPKAGPLLTAWIENRPSPLREKLCDLLKKKRIDWPYLTADRQGIVESLFFNTPAAAVPLAEAFQWQILNGEPRDASRSASLLMFVINSVDEPSRKLIASRSQEFAVRLLDQFEAQGEDRYALALVGPIIANSPPAMPAEFQERVIALSKKSRYLDSAVQAIGALKKTSAPDASSASSR
jgi:hypothetical protein